MLPEEVQRRELPRALGTLCTLLTERAQRARDDTRVVLVAMAKELGPSFMPYICNVLRCEAVWEAETRKERMRCVRSALERKCS